MNNHFMYKQHKTVISWATNETHWNGCVQNICMHSALYRMWFDPGPIEQFTATQDIKSHKQYQVVDDPGPIEQLTTTENIESY